MRSLELRIPPPLHVAVSAFAMWGLAELFPTLGPSIPGRVWLAKAGFLGGALIMVLALVELWRARTTVDPHRPQKTSSLVTGGIYRLSRNPIYLGFLLILLGWAFELDSVLAFLPIPLFVLALDRLQILPEERFLEEKFGHEFRSYAARVRRWI